ncbi:MAG: M15 family metallopeptidase [Acidimicrobiales bacterium]|nr:M15 family metallopeptidase [Acidimicrobiales bacterium]
MRAVVIGALVVAVVAGGGGRVGAEDVRQERARVQAERAEVATQVDVLQADQARVSEALAAIEANVRTQEQVAAEAARAAETAAAEAESARVAAEASEAELAELRVRLTRLAVSAYVDPPGEDLLRRFEAGSAQEDATRRAFMAMRSGRDVDVIDQVRAVQRRLEDEVRRAEAARVEAEATQASAQAAVESLGEARSAQQGFAEQVRQRLGSRLAEAAALAGLDAGLADRIAAEEAALAAAVARVAPPAEAAAPPTGGQAPGPAPGGGPAPAPAPAPPPPTTRPVPRPPTPSLRTVGGITVNVAIADQLAGLLDAARADGIVLGGSGYRDINAQIQLRRQNCGTSDYAIWDMPPDQCSPPTARPGLSLHEQGLAVDFTANGRFITSRSDPGFVWLAANAGRFGFRNLPSEPWHWSLSGG